MKMHSYISANGYLQEVTERSQRALAHLRSLTEDPSIGGWDKACLDAMVRIEPSSSTAYSECESDSQLDTRSTRVVIVSSSSDSQPSDVLRRRMVSATEDTVVELDARIVEDTTPDSSGPSTPDSSAVDPFAKLKPAPTSVSMLIHHPSQEIASASQEILELDAELVSTGTERVRYPQNLTWKNFCSYMLIPTLVYELEYPRTDR